MNREKNLIFWNCLFITCLVIANILGAKLVAFGNFVVPSAVVAYAFTFLCTDVIGELYGKEEANETVKRGLLFQIFSTILIFGAIKLPIAPFMQEFQEIFEKVLSNSFRMTIASLIGYYIAQANDVYVFHKLKEISNGKHKWLRNNASTVCSQFIDTSVFITIAFWGVVPDLFVVIYSQFFIKMILALLDTPFFYYCTRGTVNDKR